MPRFSHLLFAQLDHFFRCIFCLGDQTLRKVIKMHTLFIQRIFMTMLHLGNTAFGLFANLPHLASLGFQLALQHSTFDTRHQETNNDPEDRTKNCHRNNHTFSFSRLALKATKINLKIFLNLGAWQKKRKFS